MSNFMLSPERFSDAAEQLDSSRDERGRDRSFGGTTVDESIGSDGHNGVIKDRMSVPMELPAADVSFSGGGSVGTQAMTIAGTSRIAGLLLAFIAGGAALGWQAVKITEVVVGRTPSGSLVTTQDTSVSPLLFVAFIVAFALVIFTSFKPGWAPFTSVPYALAEGFVLGAVSHLYEADSSGIVLQALIGTIAVFFGVLFAYSTGLLRATPKFRRTVILATFGIMCVYLVGFIGNLIGLNLAFWNQSGLVGVAISLFVCAIAALNLVLDFDLIEQGAARGYPKQMEWYAAFGLVVTLVWLYLEILRLLSRRD